MLPIEKKERISYAVIKTLYAKFIDFPEDASNNRNAPFHGAFLQAFTDKFEGKVANIPFFISLSSWFHGLNTTLGQSFFEKVSHILCDGTKREFKGLQVSHTQQTVISDIITNLKNNNCPPSLENENSLIYLNNSPQDKVVSNFTADCFFEDSDRIVAIELKTVKPNSGVFKNEKDKFLQAKAGLKNVNPNKEIYFYLAFPFDPLSLTPTGYNKANFMNYSVDFTKFFDSAEVLLAGELWDYLSGDCETMQQLLDIINSIASPNFYEKYEFLNNPHNKIVNLDLYLEYLSDWNLYSEIRLVQNESRILQRISNDKNIRIFHQQIFRDGMYNIDRVLKLESLLS